MIWQRNYLALTSSLSLVGASWGYYLVMVLGPPIVVDFHVADQGL